MRRKKQTSRKIILSLIVILFLATIGFGIYKIFFEPKKDEVKPQNQSQVTKPTENQDPQKPEEKPSEEIKKPIQRYEGGDPNENEKLTGAITYTGATSNNIIIRVNIDQYVDGGSCELKLIKNDKIEYQETSNLIADVATSTCEGFNIPRSKIENGNYVIKIDLKSNEKTGSISGELNL